MTLQLPERPNLEQLKRQAKDLLHSARAGLSVERARFRILPAFSAASDAELRRISLHDAQSVVAREYGFASWNALRDRVEELTLDFDAALTEFIEAATSGRPDRARRLLALRPKIAGANFHTDLLLGNVAGVERRIAANAALATAPGGPRDWPALLYVCHSSLAHASEAEQANVALIARRLLAAGADPNGQFPWVHHGVQRRVLWAACCVARNLALAKVLLEAGANPNDGVTLTIAASGGDLAVLELLLAHGADPNCPWATDGSAPLYAILHWAVQSDGIRWLLEHGADPDPVFTPTGATPLHLAAMRWDVALVELLLARGADISRPRRDGRTPYALAQLNGNRAVADWLAAHGTPTEMSDIDRFVAACRVGDRVAADAMLRERPQLRSEIAPEHYAALHAAAERGDVPALEAMLAGGFDPNRGDEEIGKTALHSAAHEGQADAVRVLLHHGASVMAEDREFHGTPLIWAADGARTHRDRDYDPTARLLVAAGSPVEWTQGNEPSDDLLEIIERWRRLGTN